MTPYYEEPGIRLYQGDNREVLAALGIKPDDVALMWGDPPYGEARADEHHRVTWDRCRCERAFCEVR